MRHIKLLGKFHLLILYFFLIAQSRAAFDFVYFHTKLSCCLYKWEKGLFNCLHGMSHYVSIFCVRQAIKNGTVGLNTQVSYFLFQRQNEEKACQGFPLSNSSLGRETFEAIALKLNSTLKAWQGHPNQPYKFRGECSSYNPREGGVSWCGIHAPS